MSAELPHGLQPAIDVAQLARVLGVGKARVYAGVRDEGWPHMRDSRKPTASIRFAVPEDVEEIKRRLHANGAPTVSAPAPASALPTVSAAALARSFARL